MSLDDRFNKNEGDFIDRSDSRLMQLTKKSAESIQEKTGASKESIIKGAYMLGLVGFAGYTATLPGFAKVGGALLGAVTGVKANSNSLRPRNNLDTELSLKAQGLPRQTYKVIQLYFAATCVASTLAGAFSLASGVYNQDSSQTTQGIMDIAYGLGMFGWSYGDYLSKTKIDPPLKKTEKDLVKIKSLVEKVLRENKPSPVPV